MKKSFPIKILAAALSVILALSALFMFTACSDDADAKPRVTALKGPTGMGMAKLMESGDYDVTLESDPQKVQSAIVAGETDIAAVPVNLAAALYNKTEGGIRVFAVNTLGVLYILENGDTVNTVEDLRGKTISATGQGSTPEYILRYILSENGINPDTDVEIKWVAENTVLTASAASGEADIVMLPEPSVTAAMLQAGADSGLRVALDLTEQWNKINENELVQGVMIVRTEYYESNKTVLSRFMADYADSVEFITTDPTSPSLIAAQGIVASEGVAKTALPRCNIVYRDGDMRAALEPILKVLYEANPKSVGGALPAAEFYINLSVK